MVKIPLALWSRLTSRHDLEADAKAFEALSEYERKRYTETLKEEIKKASWLE